MGKAGVPSKHSPVVWRRHHATIHAWLALFSATAAQLAEFFGGRTVETRERQAWRWLVTQRKRRTVRMVGVVQRHKTGRPEIVYGRRARQRELLHELNVTSFALAYRDCWSFSRDAKVGKTEADAKLTHKTDGTVAWLELDQSGKLTCKQYEQGKWPAYQGTEGFILVVALSEERMQRIRGWCKAVRERVLLTTFERLMSDAAEPWVDFDGKATEL